MLTFTHTSHGPLAFYVMVMSPKKYNANFFQASIDTPLKNWQPVDVRMSNNLRIQIVIADLVHGDGHASSFPTSKMLRMGLRLNKAIGPNFEVPRRNQISCIILDRNFDSYWEVNQAALLVNPSVFSLGFLGDSATIVCLTFMNTLGIYVVIFLP